MHDYIIRCRGVDNFIEKCEHLKEKQNTTSNSRSSPKKSHNRNDKKAFNDSISVFFLSFGLD